MKTLAYALCFAGVAALALAQDNPKKAGSSQPPAEFKVPERTQAEKYNRLTYFNATGGAIGIAYAKSRGASVDDYATFCGDEFAKTWNKSSGFAGFARGTLANFDIWRRYGDPVIEILAQSDSQLRFKTFLGAQRSFRNGKLFGVSVDEYRRWFEVIHERVAAYMGCTYKQETLEGGFLMVTISKGPAAEAENKPKSTDS